jgi:GNAT superfamily N-acetyltransferase
MSTEGPSSWRIVPARDEHAEALAALCGQLGYPTTAAIVRERLAGLDPAVHAVWVALRHDVARGWAHVAETRALEYEPCAELLGLVVDADSRSSGAGAALVAAAEDWARGRGLREMRVRSRDTRERAHAFYRRAGYEEWKRQVVFRKAL